LVIGFGLMFFQQMCGINVAIFNATTIFEVNITIHQEKQTNFTFSQAADTNIDSNVQMIIIGAVLLISTLFGTFLVDRLGRKILLVTSSVFTTLMLIALGVYFFLLEKESKAVEKISWLPLTSLCIHFVAYSLGYGPLPWLVRLRELLLGLKRSLSLKPLGP
jgi:Na+/melibiose symporter-like transporter